MANKQSKRYKLTLSAKIDENGKSEILLRYNITREIRLRFKTGVFIEPYNFDTYTECDNTALTDYIEGIENIIQLGYDKMKSNELKNSKDWQTWLDSVLSLNINKSTATLRTIRKEQDRLADEAERAEQAAQAKAAQASRKTIYDYIEEYCKHGRTGERLSDGRITAFRSVARYLLRYQLYEQMVRGRRDFVVDYDTMITEDLRSFQNFVTDEAELIKAYPAKFATINKRVDAEMPVKHKQAIKDRGCNYVREVMLKLRTIFRYIRVTLHKTNNDPFEGMTIGQMVYGDPIPLRKSERNHLAEFDFGSGKREAKMAMRRDIFIFQCYVGARYGDLQTFTQEKNIEKKVVDGKEFWTLHYYPKKTQHHADTTEARVPLIDKAVELIKKYNRDPDKTLFPPQDEHNMVLAIKRMCRLAGIDRMVNFRFSGRAAENKKICEIVGTHTARRTFIDIAVKDGVPLHKLCKMTGHRPGSSSLARYYHTEDEELETLIKCQE